MSETLKFGGGIWATKEGSTLAYNDTNGNFKPLPFTFDRSTSATRVNKQGLIEVVPNNEPRIDFLNDSKGALLLEPQRTNLLQYSEQIDNAFWARSNVTISANEVTSPDGYTNADNLVENTSTAVHGVGNLTGLTLTAVPYTFSVFVKKQNRDFFVISTYDGSTTLDGYFNINTGAVSTMPAGMTGTITNYGNGWYRCTATRTMGANPNNYFGFNAAATDGSSTYLGTGVVACSLFGGSLELGSYATSYIPTQGSIGTRVAETCSQVIPSNISLSTSGTVFLDYTLNIKLISGHFPLSVIDYNNGSVNEWASRGSFRFIINTNGSVSYDFVLSGLVTSPTQVSNVFPNIGSRGKMAISWDGTNVTFSVNGVNYQDTLSANFTGSLDGIYLGQLGTFNNTHKEGKFNEVKLYNTRLTDQELINLTKI